MNGVVNMSGARDPPPNLLIHQIIVRLLLIEFCDVRLRIAGTPDRVQQGIGLHPDRSCARRDPRSGFQICNRPRLLRSWSISRYRIFPRELASVRDASHGLQQVWVRRSVVYEVVSQPAATSDRSWPRSIRTVS